MNVEKKVNQFYSSKKCNVSLSKYYTDDKELNKKLDTLLEDLKKGFILYSKKILERFIVGHEEIDNFAEQFIKVYEYNLTHNKYSNSEEQFKIHYGNSLGSKKWEEKKNKMRGEKNPWFKHDGKYSPFKEGSINFSKDAMAKACKNRSYNTKLNYYLDKGHSEEEAIYLLKERQATGRIDNFIKRYGDELGKEKWAERQIKWQETLQSKPQNEIDEINKKKSSGIGSFINRDIPGKLYYIYFYNKDIEFWKIGITSKSVRERFNLDCFEVKYNLKYKIIFVQSYETIQEAYNEEQRILNINNDYRIITNYNGFYTTETFNKNVLKDYYGII